MPRDPATPRPDAAVAVGTTSATPATTAGTFEGFVPAPIARRLQEGGGRLADERRLVTALFADVSGFTALSQRLDPEALHDVIAPVLGMLAEVVDDHGGYVDKFAGDAVLAMFGTPVTHEDDAERAVAAAARMHARLPDVLAELDEAAAGLTLHVGINSGHVVAREVGDARRRDYTVLGQAVNLAQRLESVAGAGETFVGGLTRQLTAHRFAYELAGRYELKGVAEPVPAWRLLGETDEATGSRPLVGRTDERARLRAAFDAARDGSAAVVTVEGEPGTGKSVLVEDLLQLAAARGAATLVGTSSAYGEQEAYGPFTEVVAGLPAATGAPDLPGALASLGAGEHLPYLGPLVGVASSDADVEPEAFRRGLGRALRAVLGALAAARPVVLALHDLHAVDADTRELVLELARAEVHRLLLVATARPEGAEVLSTLRAVGPSAAQVVLGPLPRSGVAELLGHELAAEPGPALLDHIVDRSGGNPLFVTQLAATLLELEAAVVTDGTAELVTHADLTTVPASLEGLLGGRMDRLPLDAAELLQVAAVLGRETDVDLLESVAGIDDVRSRLRALEQAGLAATEETATGLRVRLEHALIEDVAYTRLVRRRRNTLHVRAADVLQARGLAGLPELEEVAHHLVAADVGGRAVDALVRAASAAADVFANAAAIDHLERALEQIDRHGERSERVGDLALELGRLRELVGDYAAATDAYTRARDLTGTIDAWRGIASSRRRAGDHDAARAALAGAFEAVGDADDERALWLEEAWTLEAGGDLPGAERAARRGLELRPDARDRTQAELWLLLAVVLEHAMRLDEARTAAESARRVLAGSDLPATAARLARVEGAVLVRLGEHETAERVLREGRELAERVGSVEELGGTLTNLALLRYQAGDLEEAVDLTREALAEFERVGHRSGRIINGCNLATMLAECGETGHALDVAERALALADEVGDHYHAGDALDAMVRAHLALGDQPAAASAARRAAARYRAAGADELAEEVEELVRRDETETRLS